MDTKKLAVGIEEAAVLLSVSPRFVRNLIRSQTIVARKVGRRTLIPVRSLERFLRKDHASPEKAADK